MGSHVSPLERQIELRFCVAYNVHFHIELTERLYCGGQNNEGDM